MCCCCVGRVGDRDAPTLLRALSISLWLLVVLCLLSQTQPAIATTGCGRTNDNENKTNWRNDHGHSSSTLHKTSSSGFNRNPTTTKQREEPDVLSSLRRQISNFVRGEQASEISARETGNDVASDEGGLEGASGTEPIADRSSSVVPPLQRKAKAKSSKKKKKKSRNKSYSYHDYHYYYYHKRQRKRPTVMAAVPHSSPGRRPSRSTANRWAPTKPSYSNKGIRRRRRGKGRKKRRKDLDDEDVTTRIRAPWSAPSCSKNYSCDRSDTPPTQSPPATASLVGSTPPPPPPPAPSFIAPPVPHSSPRRRPSRSTANRWAPTKPSYSNKGIRRRRRGKGRKKLRKNVTTRARAPWSAPSCSKNYSCDRGDKPSTQSPTATTSLVRPTPPPSPAPSFITPPVPHSSPRRRPTRSTANRWAPTKPSFSDKGIRRRRRGKGRKKLRKDVDNEDVTKRTRAPWSAPSCSKNYSCDRGDKPSTQSPTATTSLVGPTPPPSPAPSLVTPPTISVQPTMHSAPESTAPQLSLLPTDDSSNPPPPSISPSNQPYPDIPSISPSPPNIAPQSDIPSIPPSNQPYSDVPSIYPSNTAAQADLPSISPSNRPLSEIPSISPFPPNNAPQSDIPSISPSNQPYSEIPSIYPSPPNTAPQSDSPSISPSNRPYSDIPSISPSYEPSDVKSLVGSPSSSPSSSPLSPSLDPSVKPTNTPSTNPTGCPDQNRTSALLKRLSPVTNQSILLDSGTPQGQAFVWLKDSDMYTDPCSYATLEQRYSLAVLFFSTNGTSWIEQAEWISRSEECNWFGISCDGLSNSEVVKVDLGKLEMRSGLFVSRHVNSHMSQTRRL